MAANNLIFTTEKFKNDVVGDFIAQQSNSTFYIFAGRHIPWPNNDVTITAPTDAKEVVVDTYQNMIFGKVVTTSDMNAMIPRYNWTANTVYAQWDDQDANLFSKAFYVAVNATSQYYIFECLYNANGAPSTVSPSYPAIGPSDAYVQLSDGYFWKYLYTVDSNTFNKFATTDYMPVYQDSNTAGNTVAGAIDVVLVTNQGSGYNNYLSGQFLSSDIQVGGNSVIFNVVNNAVAVNGYYNNCVLYINGGTGKGQFRKITNYTLNGLQKLVQVNSAFTITPDITSTYVVNPYVQIVGDSSVTANAEGMALINASSSNSIYQIDVLARGAGYRLATANIQTAAVVGVVNAASARCIVPPVGGHGYNNSRELGGIYIGVSVKFGNTESNTIPTQNDYRQVGLIRDPLWANVQLNLLNSANNPGTNGQFLFHETALVVRPIQLQGTAITGSGNAQITGNGTNFSNQLLVGDYVYLTAGGSAWIGTVTGIANNTSLTLSSNVLFSNTANISLIKVLTSGNVQGITTSSINISGLDETVATGQLVVGSNSFAVGTIGSYAINGLTKNFNTFVQCTRYYGSVTSGAFTPDETVYEGNIALGNASFHSINSVSNGATSMLVTNQDGVFGAGGTITGSNSGATFLVNSQIPGDLVLDSGKLLYLDNFTAISRSDSQTEYVRIVLGFTS